VDEESVPLKSADANTKVRLEDNLQMIQKHDIKGTNKLTNREELVDITTFPQYQEILIQNNELKEALEKATQLVQASTIHDNSIVDFEFSLSYEIVQNYVSSRGNINQLWFNGRLEKQTEG
jgi:phosphopantetheinyl transferase (holo-ACP synthase)